MAKSKRGEITFTVRAAKLNGYASIMEWDGDRETVTLLIDFEGVSRREMIPHIKDSLTAAAGAIFSAMEGDI